MGVKAVRVRIERVRVRGGVDGGVGGGGELQAALESELARLLAAGAVPDRLTRGADVAHLRARLPADGVERTPQALGVSAARELARALGRVGEGEGGAKPRGGSQ